MALKVMRLIVVSGFWFDFCYNLRVYLENLPVTGKQKKFVCLGSKAYFTVT